MRDKRDARRRIPVVGGAAAAVAVVIALGVFLHGFAKQDVDVETGVAAIQAMEKADVTVIEEQIAQIEEQERQEEEAAARELAEQTGNGASGQEEIRDDRPLSAKYASAVVMGDSIANGFRDFDLLSADKVVAEIGVAMPDMDSMLDRVEQIRPQVLFLAFGHNDITNTAGDTQEFVRQFGEICTELKSRLPETKIYVNLLFPVQDKALETYPEYADMDRYNQALQQYCAQEELPVIDATGLALEEYFEPDGEHFTQPFYEAWGDYMAKEAGI